MYLEDMAASPTGEALVVVKSYVNHNVSSC